jgi:hypothetical protein
MHISVFIYLLFDQYNPLIEYAQRKENQIISKGSIIPKTPAYKYIHLFIVLFLSYTFFWALQTFWGTRPWRVLRPILP